MVYGLFNCSLKLAGSRAHVETVIRGVQVVCCPEPEHLYL